MTTRPSLPASPAAAGALAPAAERFRVVPAAYLFLRRGDPHGDEVLLQLRGRTGYMEGWWAAAAAGHVERGESALAAAAREAVEELGIEVAPADLEPLTTLHRTVASHAPVEERLDLFFTCRAWSGEPVVREPDKCRALRWFPLGELPDRVVPHERMVLEALAAGSVPRLLTRGFAQRITLVAALGRNRAIGVGGGMPWHLPEDLAHFKRTTLGGTMIMGRRTWESIGRPLPGRHTVVVTRQREWEAPGATVVNSLAEALLVAGDEEVFVVGGGEIYAQAMPWAHRLVLTHVDVEPHAEVYFPLVDPAVWREVTREPRDGFAFVTYERR
ncbi:MAG TPA: dihydrofolate reductase [Segeticoccus sp.]|uniref:dihydrofolate reductase n=1 Tax=Segeticoccus sp. TaxID=2706531 RepID=UPI002D809397|nr:dihydrofolate reductase [Segeticoccus sp.]HET8601364.1 dihydrofolate reductase [Segeticoccus sp.]